MSLRTFMAIVFALAWLPATPAKGADLVWVVQGGLRLQQQVNPLLFEEDGLRKEQSLTGVGLSLGVLAGLQLGERVSLAMQFDAGELVLANLRRPSGDQFALFANDFLLNRPGSDNGAGWLLEESMFLRELYATIWLNKRGWHRLIIGQRHLSIASSVLFDQYALGFFIEADLRKRRWRKRKPLYIRLSVFLPDSSWTRQGKLSPTAHISVLYDKRWLQIEAHAAYMFDGGGTTGRMLWPALQRNIPSFQQASLAPSCQLRSTRCEAMPASSGHHFWAGANVRAGVLRRRSGLSLFATALGYGGLFQVDLPELPDQLTGFGVYLDAGVTYTMGPMSASINLLYVMGAEEGTGPNGYLHGFRSIAPQMRHQHIMFPGGYTTIGSKRTLGLAQLSNGYWGMQFALEYVERSADVKLIIGTYGSDFNTSTMPTTNGAEIPRSLDIEASAKASVDLTRYFKLIGQFDMYLPGGFLIDRSRPPVFRLWVGFDFSFRSW